MIVDGWLPDAHRWPLRLSLRAVNLDIFDPQRRFVAVAAERVQDLADGVVDLLGAAASRRLCSVADVLGSADVSRG
jgi:hypothetical protein